MAGKKRPRDSTAHPPSARYSRPKKDWPATFLAALARSANVTAACRAAGVTRRGAHTRREADEAFRLAWDDAIEESTDSLVGEAYRRATQGTEKPVFYQGDECGSVREYSDTLAIFLLKSHRPAVYRETVRQEHSGPDGGAIRVDAATREEAARELDQWREEMRARLSSSPSVPPTRPTS